MHTPQFGNLHDYYAHRARWIAQHEPAQHALPDVQTWRELRPQVRERFYKALGLDALPERCDLKPIETGTFEGPGYTAKKLGYQVLPNCWGSAHLFRPTDVADDEPTPAVLYTCGHNPAGVVGYHAFAAAWAQRGYTCLIFDTIEQHDNPGDHHGLNRAQTPEWLAMNFSAAGGEVYNGMRALDLLLSQPGVDPDRVGVTGLSGGGAQSFFLAAADERIRAVATLCGVSDPAYAIASEQVHAHCDCMYVRNIFGDDLALYAALIAPRALLYCFARHDALYTPEEFRDLYQRTRARFERLGCADMCALHEYDGPHGYNYPETADAVHDWFDRHVFEQARPPADPVTARANGVGPPERTLSVFDGHTPEPNHLNLLPHLLTPRGQLPLPQNAAQWPGIKQQVVARLRDGAFPLLDDVQQPQQLEQVGQWHGKFNLAVRDDYTGRLDGMHQRIVYLAPPKHEAVTLAVGERHESAFDVARRLRAAIGELELGVLGVEPRAAGVSAFREQARGRLNREGALVGMTPTMNMVQDLHHLWPHLCTLPAVRGQGIYLYGKGEGAIAILCHALLNPDPQVAGIILEDLPRSLEDTPYQVMSMLRVADLWQAVALLAPTPVALVNANHGGAWADFADRLAARIDAAAPVRVSDALRAYQKLVTAPAPPEAAAPAAP